MLKFVVGVALAAVATSCGPSQIGTTPSPGAPPATSTSPLIHHWAMPNLVGSGLQDAQDAIQKLTGNEIFFSGSHDVSGKGRHQILDRDWKVCSQNIAAGTQIQAGVKIDFGVVKLAEQCP
ncbi:PASTA domain-containing protein [Kutzneria kofuensis]|uniref:PASTA domain-containing protein n=1 Tax=Kutzneria kofuensis TaxID=103725 RepID=A0A7W9KA78_9PSEU|nr:PASTA domain-containing protein [Kutzneria kofuensis]MBB5888898.1 hypothetical protein [Kutzneria kofuensis]